MIRIFFTMLRQKICRHKNRRAIPSMTLDQCMNCAKFIYVGKR
jgi:hypothetical protein